MYADAETIEKLRRLKNQLDEELAAGARIGILNGSREASLLCEGELNALGCAFNWQLRFDYDVTAGFDPYPSLEDYNGKADLWVVTFYSPKERQCEIQLRGRPRRGVGDIVWCVDHGAAANAFFHSRLFALEDIEFVGVLEGIADADFDQHIEFVRSCLCAAVDPSHFIETLYEAQRAFNRAASESPGSDD